MTRRGFFGLLAGATASYPLICRHADGTEYVGYWAVGPTLLMSGTLTITDAEATAIARLDQWSREHNGTGITGV